MDTQHDILHTFSHFTVLCALCAFPNTPVLVTETVSSIVRVVSDACHALWEPVIILHIPLSEQKITERPS